MLAIQNKQKRSVTAPILMPTDDQKPETFSINHAVFYFLKKNSNVLLKKNIILQNVHIIGKLIFSSFIWHRNHDGRVTYDWAETICTWYGTLTFCSRPWGRYARVKNHNEPNIAAIHLFWTIWFLSVPLQIVCNRSCVIHWSCLWCHMKEENMSFPMMCTGTLCI